jgi:hypothetical protein
LSQKSIEAELVARGQIGVVEAAPVALGSGLDHADGLPVGAEQVVGFAESWPQRELADGDTLRSGQAQRLAEVEVGRHL